MSADCTLTAQMEDEAKRVRGGDGRRLAASAGIEGAGGPCL